MGKSFLCKIGLHKWGRATFVDHAVHSNILDWRQNCDRCGKRITWVQPKNIDEKFYPLYWSKKIGWWTLFLLILVGVVIYLIIK